MGWVVIMTPPLPDAPKKSPRVYRNLQTKDLEDVTFADVEATGDPLAIELHNEDELRRLVLVQLARLTVKSEWSGLLTSSAVSFPLLAPDGSSGAPSYSFSGDTDMGMYRTGSNLSFSVGGEKLRVSASGLQAIPDGTTATPGISFAGDTQSGLLQPATNNIAIATNANERIRVGDAGQIGIGGANYGTDGQVLTSKGASAAVEWADAGGGGSSYVVPLPATPFSSTYKFFQVSNFAPYATVGVGDNASYYLNTRPTAFPFIAPFSGDIDDAAMSVTTSQTGAKCNVGIYTANSNNYPDAKIAEIEFDASSTGVKSSVAITQTTSLVAGNFYYYVFWGYAGSPIEATAQAIDDEHVMGFGPSFALNTSQVSTGIRGANLTTGTTLPATFDTSGGNPQAGNRPIFALVKNP